MGETTRSNGIKDFWPDDTEEKFHISTETSLWDIQDLAERKWPDGFSDLLIEAQHVHTSCLGYDRYDYFDYTDFIVVTRIKKE